MQCKALVFDAYGTLFDVHSVGRTCERLFPGKGAALSQLWRTKQLEYTWLRSLMGRYADFNQVTRDSLRFTCNALGCEYSQAALDTLMQAYRELDVFSDAKAAVAALGTRGMPLGILSNGAPDMLNAVVRHNGLEHSFACVLSVDAVQVFKPAPAVYELAVQQFACPAAQIGFVSSNGWDAAGAKAFGFQVFWVNRNRMPVEELGVAPDHQLATLTELSGLTL